ncbi:pyridoxal-phosphate dependent enzyme [Thermosipho ferrireducens]|uniref:Pyridoxal-phosphate dependent enzyme n=1 Tax=Thermosipho ferrireducens TaxID=2571116 RepID=A0ABX7S563_9BACT|nr:pyridoxal-phosphate dependent enzyme [Thermosipho ferrireducens]QTA37642.1 pyridoxal-phosphate dependent enzyme [Thermosipho ferrireducens]
MAKKIPVVGPTFEEMLHPWKIDPEIRKRAIEMKKKDPLHPVNLYNITWRDENDEIYYFVMPKELTGVDANIIVLYAKNFPSGSHKVGATYSVLAEKTVSGEVDPLKHTLIWPSTGNYGIGGAWVSSRMNYKSIVILPELMSKERFELIRKYGSEVIATPGCESNVKEIYDKSKELYQKDPEHVRILNQFEEFGNYRFHYYVTGNTMIELVKEKKIGNGRISAIVLGVGSAGTIASGDRVKQEFPETKVVTVEPLQCPTIAMNGYGGHDIQGIGDKHVTWIHNVMNNDAVVLVDDMDSKKMLQVLSDPEGMKFLKEFVPSDAVDFISDKFGISGVANLIGAIKIAKFYNFSSEDNIFIVATDSIERYRSVMEDLTRQFGKLDRAEAKSRTERILLYQEPSWIFEGDKWSRERWHNLKYYTWVEQQGKTVEELDKQRDQAYWRAQQEKVFETNKLIEEYREAHKNELMEMYFSD